MGAAGIPRRNEGGTSANRLGGPLERSIETAPDPDHHASP
jgi:hypothetical protein